jgi:polyphenol oxidase
MNRNKIIKFDIFKKDKNIVAGVSTKALGNLELKHGDKNQVDKNKKKLAKALNIKVEQLYEMEQVHGSKIIVLTKANIDRFKSRIVAKTDALITNLSDVYLMVKTADCFPVLMYDEKNKVVAAVHAGWRGTVEKVFLEVLLKLITEFNTQAKDLKIAIGPGIKPCCFKHQSLIQNKLPEWKQFIKKQTNGWLSLNINGFIIEKLLLYGVKKDNINNINFCTSCEPNLFSHFKALRKKEKPGRMGSIIGIKREKQ